MLFKYGKPRRYLFDLVVYYAQPRSDCAFARETKLTTSFIKGAEKKERDKRRERWRSRSDRSRTPPFANCSRSGISSTT